MLDNGVLALVPCPVGPAKAGMTKPTKRCDIHHLDDARKYLQVCNFSNFIKTLLNCVPNDFLQQGSGPELILDMRCHPGGGRPP
jgi:hypothetical protein